MPNRTEDRHNPTFCEPSAEVSSFRAGLGSAPDIRQGVSTAHIQVKGIKCDRISALSSAGCLDFGVSPGVKAPLLEIARRKLAFVQHAIDLVHSEESTTTKNHLVVSKDQLWSALVADRILHRMPPPAAYKAFLAEWLHFMDVMAHTRDSQHLQEIVQHRERGGGSLAGVLWEDEQGNRLEYYNSSMMEACHSRCFGITESGRMCLGPPFTEIGDGVFVVYGARTPLLIRQVQVLEKVGTFDLVGEAYVQGIMMGEMLDYVGLEVVVELQ